MGHGDGVKTTHFWGRVFSKDNATQLSTAVGTVLSAGGVAAQQTGDTRGVVVGALMQVLGGILIGHDSNAGK